MFDPFPGGSAQNQPMFDWLAGSPDQDSAAPPRSPRSFSPPIPGRKGKFWPQFGRDFKKWNFVRTHFRPAMGVRCIEEYAFAGKTAAGFDAGGDRPGQFARNGNQVRCQDDNPPAAAVLQSQRLGKKFLRFA